MIKYIKKKLTFNLIQFYSKISIFIFKSQYKVNCINLPEMTLNFFVQFLKKNNLILKT